MRYLKRNRHGWEYQRRVPVDLKEHLENIYPAGWVRLKLPQNRADAVREVVQITARLELEWDQIRDRHRQRREAVAAVAKNAEILKQSMTSLDPELAEQVLGSFLAGRAIPEMTDDVRRLWEQEVVRVENANPEELYEILLEDEKLMESLDLTLQSILIELEAQLISEGINPQDDEIARSVRENVQMRPAGQTTEVINRYIGLKPKTPKKVIGQGRHWEAGRLLYLDFLMLIGSPVFGGPHDVVRSR